MPVKRLRLNVIQVTSESGAQASRPVRAAQVDIAACWKGVCTFPTDLQTNGSFQEKLKRIAAWSGREAVHPQRALRSTTRPKKSS